MSLSFNELIPNASVRVTKIEDVTYMSVRDLIMVLCQKNNNDAGETWRNIPETNKSEVQEKVLNFKFPGRGQQMQPVITLEGALMLLMWLPGDNAKSYRTKATEIITRFIAGDTSLIQEIQANSQSSNPINQLARDALGKRKAELEDLEIQERKARLKKLEIETQALTRQTQEDIMKTYTSLCPNQTLDARAKSMFRDTFLNLATQGQQTIPNSEDSGKLLTISELADRLGIRFKPGDLTSLGREVKAWHYNTYHEDPGTAPKFVNGHETEICAYEKKDWPTIEKMLRDYKK